MNTNHFGTDYSSHSLLNSNGTGGSGLLLSSRVPIFILGIVKKTTKSDVVFDEVFQDISFMDKLSVCIEPYQLFCSTTLSDRIDIDDFPEDLQKMISSLERQELIQSLEVSCLQANTKRWQLISECSKIPYNYRYSFWTQIVRETYNRSYRHLLEKIEVVFGSVTKLVCSIVTYIPFQLFCLFNVFIVGFFGLVLDVCFARVYLRQLTCVQDQVFDIMMLYPEYSTNVIDDVITEDLEKIANSLERIYQQFDVVVARERYFLPPAPGCCGSTVGATREMNIEVPLPAVKDYEDYDLELKKHSELTYEERFLLYFYPHPNTLGAKDIVYFNSNFNSSGSFSNLSQQV